MTAASREAAFVVERIFQVDAFSSEPFHGNPAAVCMLSHEPDTSWMQSVAAEMNLSETAFVVPRGNRFGLRWFTPTTEARLCGHATLASAHVLWEIGVLAENEVARFDTLSGPLEARCSAEGIVIDLPAIRMVEAELSGGAADALGIRPRTARRTAEPEHHDLDYLVEVATEDELRAARPDFAGLKRALKAGVIVTARSSTSAYDFVSRYFAPLWGIDEDPVTGAAHCCLAPYWSERLGKNEMMGFQASSRGGVVGVELVGERVRLTGRAVTVLRGELTL
jgi:PhzF family phenazine biosynthesis protein